jgi:hypothetical protein
VGVKLHVDLETLQLIEGPGFRNPVGTLRFKRGDGAGLEVVFLTNGTTPSHIGDPAGLELKFGAKPRGRYDVGYIVSAADWTLPDPADESPTYRCNPSFNTVELNAAMQVGSPTGSELSELVLMGEITWRQGSGEPTSTRTFMVVVENDVNRGTEGIPTDADPAYPSPELLVLQTDTPWLDSKAVLHDRPQSLEPGNQEQARQNIRAALDVVELDRDPLSEDIVDLFLTGTFTTDGTTPLPTPQGPFIAVPNNPDYWQTAAPDSDWEIGRYWNGPTDWYIWHLDTGSTWYSQPGDDLETAVWTSAGANTGTPVVTRSVVTPKDTGRWAVNSITGSAWINVGAPNPDWRQISKKEETVLLEGNQAISGLKTFTQFPAIPTTAPSVNHPVSRAYLETQVRKFPSVNVTATQDGVSLAVSEVAPSTWRLNVDDDRAAPIIFRINAPGWTDWILGGYNYFTSNIAFRINAMFGYGVHLDKQERIMEWAVTGSKHGTYAARVTQLLNIVTPFGSACPVTNAVITQDIVNLGKHDFIITASNGGGALNASMLVSLKPL